MIRSWLVSVSVSFSAFVFLGFTPFTVVPNVCPKCLAPAMDVVVLNSGQKIHCQVVAQNEDYYILLRNGEFRTVEKSEVIQVKWKEQSGIRNLAAGDQILLKNGLVLHGKMVTDQPGRVYIISVENMTHTIWAPYIQAVYSAGKRVFPEGP